MRAVRAKIKHNQERKYMSLSVNIRISKKAYEELKRRKSKYGINIKDIIDNIVLNKSK